MLWHVYWSSSMIFGTEVICPLLGQKISSQLRFFRTSWAQSWPQSRAPCSARCRSEASSLSRKSCVGFRRPSRALQWSQRQLQPRLLSCHPKVSPRRKQYNKGTPQTGLDLGFTYPLTIWRLFSLTAEQHLLGWLFVSSSPWLLARDWRQQVSVHPGAWWGQKVEKILQSLFPPPKLWGLWNLFIEGGVISK